MAKEAKNKENKNAKKAKEKKSFLKDTRAELKKVIWPTSKQLINNTLAVIAVVLIIGIIVLVLDICFEKMNEFGVDKLKEAVQSIQQNEETTENIESDPTEIELSNEEIQEEETNSENDISEGDNSETAESNTNNDEVVENAE